MSGPIDLPHHFKPAMSPPAQQQQQQQQNQQSQQHIFNQLQVASNLGPVTNAAMSSSEKVTGVGANSQFPNNMSNDLEDPHFQVGSLANYQAQVKTRQHPPQRVNPRRSPQNMISIDPQAVRTAQAHQSPCEHANTHRSLQNGIIVSPQSPRNAHDLALHRLQNYWAPTQAHPQGQAGPHSTDLSQAQMQAQVQSLFHSQHPTNQALTRMIVDRNRGTGFLLPLASSPAKNERYSGHDGRGNNGMENRTERDRRYGFMPSRQGFPPQDNRNGDSPIRPTLQGFQHQDTCDGGSPNWNGTPGRQQLLRPSFNPHSHHQNSHLVTNSNQAYRPALNSTSSPRQPVQASPSHPFRIVASVNEGYGRLQCSLPPSSRATGPAPNACASASTRRPIPTPVSHRSPLAPAQNHDTELKRMLNTRTSQYAEGPPNKRPHSVPPISTIPLIGNFASPTIPRPASIAANPAVCPPSVAFSRRSVQPINSSSLHVRGIDRHAYENELFRKQWALGLFLGHDTAMETFDVLGSPKSLKATREHINDDEGLRYDKPDAETGDPFSGFRKEAKYLGHKLPNKVKQRTEPDALEYMLETCHKAESELELDMLAKRFGVRLSKVDTGQGGVHLATGDNVWLAPGRKLRVAHYSLPNHPKEFLDTEKEKEDTWRMVVDLTGPDVTPLVFHPAPTDHMGTLLKLTTRRPLPGVDVAHCTVDEDGGLHAPNPESPTEQHADLMWLLKSHEEKEMHGQSDNDESGARWMVEDGNG